MFTQSSSNSYDVVSVIAHKKIFLIILTLMSVAGLIGSDVYLPTLPFIGDYFARDPHSMQFTLSIYLFGLSIGQLCFGPLTDRFGRKNLTILGMLLYFIASLACVFSSSYMQLLFSRFFQAIGACSGLTISRAIVGDLFSKQESGKIFSTIFPFVGMSPAISPVIGGFLGYYFGWQSTFIFVGLFALTIILVVVLYLPETLPTSKRQSLHLIKIIYTYPKLLVNKKFVAYALAPCMAYFVYFAYLTQSPFIFSQYGYDERAIGTFYIALSITYVAGNLLGKQLLNYFKIDDLLKFGFLVFNVGAILLFIAGLLPGSQIFLMIFAMSILTIGNGFLLPLGTAGAINSSGSIGYASGLLGFLQLGAAAISSIVVGKATNNSVVGLGIYILFMTLVSAVSFLFLINGKEKIDHVF